MAFLVWGLLACSGVYWVIQVAARPLATPAQAVPALEQGAAQVDLTRLLGAPVVVAAEPVVAQEGRFRLLGVVAPRSARAAQAGEGVALIAVDGVPRTVRVGAEIENGLRLLAVDARSARLGTGDQPGMTLQMAAPSQASTGALTPAGPSGVNLGGNVPMPQVMPPMPTSNLAPGQPQPDQQQPQVDNRGNPLS